MILRQKTIIFSLIFLANILFMVKASETPMQLLKKTIAKNWENAGFFGKMKAQNICGSIDNPNNKYRIYSLNSLPGTTKKGFSFKDKSKGKFKPEVDVYQAKGMIGSTIGSGNLILDTSKSTRVVVSMLKEKIPTKWMLNFPAGKTIYITMRSKNGEVYFYGQTGFDNGRIGVTEDCILKNNTFSENLAKDGVTIERVGRIMGRLGKPKNETGETDE